MQPKNFVENILLAIDSSLRHPYIWNDKTNTNSRMPRNNTLTHLITIGGSTIGAGNLGFGGGSNVGFDSFKSHSVVSSSGG